MPDYECKLHITNNTELTNEGNQNVGHRLISEFQKYYLTSGFLPHTKCTINADKFRFTCRQMKMIHTFGSGYLNRYNKNFKIHH